MSKNTHTYVCQECGLSHPKWLGRCEGCNSWNTLIEEVTNKSHKSSNKQSVVTFQLLEDINNNNNYQRLSSGNTEFDRVCGGGLVPGSVILVGGEPGIGKSTLLLQIAAKVSESIETFYISGEEALSQIHMRSKRLGVSTCPLKLASTTNINEILASFNPKKKSLIIVDSIQTMHLDNIESAPGSVSQVRACAYALQAYAKQNDCILVLVGHVTKEGNIAGPRVLEHMVDTVLYFEGERTQNYRILRSVKNRFGATDEIGVFVMCEQGLQCVENPSSFFLSHTQKDVSGIAIAATMEGTRPILVDVQALVSPTHFAVPKRTTVGWDSNRLSMILAVLESRCRYNFHNKDVYVNIGGGLKISEPAADLAIAAALISSLLDKPIEHSCIFFGEIGLTGQVRPVFHTSQRLKEAKKLGFETAYYSLEKKSPSSSFSQSVNITHLHDLKKIFT